MKNKLKHRLTLYLAIVIAYVVMTTITFDTQPMGHEGHLQLLANYGLPQVIIIL